MINAKRVFVYNAPVDMRKSYDGLFSLIKSQKPFSGDIFLFISKNRLRFKALYWDKNGLIIFMKRLESGRYADILKRGVLTMEEFKIFISGAKIAKTPWQSEEYAIHDKY